jgi:threonine-phosphate decarboxylase
MGHIDFSPRKRPEVLRSEHGGNIYKVKREFRKDIIDFSASINPLGVPSSVKKAIYKNFNTVLYYPDPEARNITQKIAQYWRIKEENILVGNGSIELIYLIMYAFKPKTTVVAVPTFSEYESAARCIKSKIRFIRLKEKDNYKLEDSKISKADILFLCNPNNPTGNLILNGSQIIGKLPGKLIVVDEAFMDFLPDEKCRTLIWEAKESKNIVVLRTFTKFFALPGLRIGYLIAHKDVIRTLRQYQIPWSVNVFAQVAARIMLHNKSYINKTRLLIEKERGFLFNEITKIKGLNPPYPSVTNFLLIKIENKNLTSSLLVKRLIHKGILIRDCANFRGLNNRFIRIAVRSHKENLKLLEALGEVI